MFELGGKTMTSCLLAHHASHSQEKNFYTTKQTAEMQIARFESLSGTIRDNVFLNLSIIPGVFTFDYLICEHPGSELLRK